MNYYDLTLNEKKKIQDKIKAHHPDANINIDEIRVEKSSDGYLKVSYKGIVVEIPIQKPDQSTSNSIWSTLAGGAIAIAAVAVTLRYTKD